MAKKYTGSLTLDWFNKNKSIIQLSDDSIKSENDVIAPFVNWINKDEALFYEISNEKGIGKQPYWVDRNDIRIKEARPLIFQTACHAIEKDKKGTIPGTDTFFELEELSETDSINIKNLLIKGDNLLALNSIKQKINTGVLPKIKLILIDPPYNTKKAFVNYEDNLEHSEWLSLMRDRLVILKDLLADDGVIAVHIDDSESAYLKLLMDEIFGRNNFLQTFIWETDGNSDNQARFICLHEYIHVYAKDESLIDYPTVKDPNIPKDSKLFRDTIQNTIIKNGVKNPPSDVVLPKGFPAQFKEGIIQKASVNFPKYNTDLIIKDGVLQNEVIAYSGWSSKSLLLEFISNNFNPIIDGKEQKTVFALKDTGAIEAIKERNVGYGYVISVLRNMGNTQKMGKEIKDTYNLTTDFPKPESLTSYLISIFSSENDTILDCFAGSGTTLTSCLKTNRCFIGIEIGNHADTHILKRLKGVITGNDQIGISSQINWKGGGSFKYYLLGESIIQIDNETGKGEFNWSLGKQFIQESLLLSYDFRIQNELFVLKSFNENENPAIGKITGRGGSSLYGIAYLASPESDIVSISNEDITTIYKTIKSQSDFHSLVIYTNMGIDIAEDSVPDDMEIIKVPHAIFSELER